MKIILDNKDWELTDVHSASRDGQPVLVCRKTGNAYSPTDMIRAYSYWPDQPAWFCVVMMTRVVELTSEEKAFVNRFIELGPR